MILSLSPAPRHGVRRGIVTLLACAVLTAVPVPAGAAPVASATQSSITAVKKSSDFPDVDWIVCEINKERAVNGVPALTIVDRASTVANAHAADMFQMNKLTSVGSDGRTLRDRLNDASIYSRVIQEFMFYGYKNNGYFADMATDNTPANTFYKALMSQDIVAFGMGEDNMYTDVILLGYHRRLGQRDAVCGDSASLG